MKNKGLCATCICDATCAFKREYPVLFCEEFDLYEQWKKTNKTHRKHNKKENKT